MWIAQGHSGWYLFAKLKDQNSKIEPHLQLRSTESKTVYKKKKMLVD